MISYSETMNAFKFEVKFYCTREYIKAYYEVTDNLGTHLLARCLYHESLKHREGEEDFCISTPYLVKKGNSIANSRAATLRVEKAA